MCTQWESARIPPISSNGLSATGESDHMPGGWRLLPTTAEHNLRGRRNECAALDLLVSTARTGESQVLVLRGDPGCGKTALLTYVSEQLAGWRTLTVCGIESEMELAYGGLHQLCAPVLDGLDGLPPPQRNALTTVFGMSLHAPPDRFLVALATLTLLADTAEVSPLACVVDDAQWLDQASVQVLGFVARRLLAEPVVFVCAARTDARGDAVLAGLPELRLGGLGDQDARALLLDHVQGPLDTAVIDQIVAESQGNPLALLELPRTWSALDVAGGYNLPDDRPLSSKIEQSYAQRLAALPVDTQLLLVVAAADPLGDPALLNRAASTLDIDMAAAGPAVDAGLIRTGHRVQFAHPLVRSAIYRAASRDERHRAHRALAGATDAELDPDRRAWHRARATKTANEAVAGDLEKSAARAQSRGGFAAAGAFLARATELTPAPAQRTDRALGAAMANLRAGAFDEAHRMLSIAVDGALDDAHRAQVDLLNAQLSFASSRGAEAPPLLLAAARRLEARDAGLARETYLDAISAALFGARLNSGLGVDEIVAAARAAPRHESSAAAAADLLLDGLVALETDYASGIPACRTALTSLAQLRDIPSAQLRRLWQGAVVALEIWDDESAYLLSERHVETARKLGALSDLALALSLRTPVLVFAGELADAVSLVTDSRSVEDVTGVASAPYGAMMVAAWQGRGDEGRRLIDASIDEVTARGEGVGVAISEYANAVICNSAGDYEGGLAAAQRASAYREVVAENWSLPEVVEAAARSGRHDVAVNAAARLAEKAHASGSDWATGLAARAQALITDDESADSSYLTAIAHLRNTRMRGDLARTHLLHGEWQRRMHRTRDARQSLTAAYEMFAEMGMEGFAERAHRDLQALGATVLRHTSTTRDDLTPQEAQIARLAGTGMSNPEIGAQLFISSRTVEWHLRKVFMKLGITSRRQLRPTQR
jgi:DNA-binding CsgD family transcriptional regulator